MLRALPRFAAALCAGLLTGGCAGFRGARAPEPAAPAAEAMTPADLPGLGLGEGELAGLGSPAPSDAGAKSERYAFRVPLGWKGPVSIAEGVKFASPEGKAVLSIAYHPKSSPRFVEPPEYRRRLRDKGSVVDRHVVDPIFLAGRFGSRAWYTSTVYGPERLLGSSAEIYFSEEIMLPDADGIYLLLYRARREDFNRLRPGYVAFLRSLILPKPRGKPERYYLDQDHILAEPIVESVNPDASQHIARNIFLDHRFQAGFYLGKPLGFGLNAFGAINDKWSAGLYYGLAAIGKTKSIGARARWHFRDSMSTGFYAFGDLAFVKASLPPAGGGETVAAKKSGGLVLNAGAGWLYLWDRFSFNFALGYGFKKRLGQQVVGAGGAARSSSVTAHGIVVLDGGVRF